MKIYIYEGDARLQSNPSFFPQSHLQQLAKLMNVEVHTHRIAGVILITLCHRSRRISKVAPKANLVVSVFIWELMRLTE